MTSMLWIFVFHQDTLQSGRAKGSPLDSNMWAIHWLIHWLIKHTDVCGPSSEYGSPNMHFESMFSLWLKHTIFYSRDLHVLGMSCQLHRAFMPHQGTFLQKPVF